MRLVLLFDKKNGTYTVLGHNYEDGESDQVVREHRKNGIPAYHMEQKGLHEGPHEKCRTCARAVERKARRK